ncbi:MAG: MoaD/ThiS family protein [Deltaproteobacteria bacterium]|nr:MoaD/ThiS family protein [Deltaproteobacteria bacterium]
MKVNLKCFATLSKDSQCDYRESTAYDLSEGATVNDLAERAEILPKDIKIAFVNSRVVALETVLSDGDNVGLAPAVGGM